VVQSTDYSVLFLTDTHINISAGFSGTVGIMNWAWQNALDLSGVFIGGDVPYSGSELLDLSTLSAFTESTGVPIRYGLGNHESAYYTGDDGGTLPDLFDHAIAQFGLIGTGYGASQVHSLRVLFVNDLSDTTYLFTGGVNYYNAYYDCNPPGVHSVVGLGEENPDFSGVLDSTSIQNTWIRGQVEGAGSSWVVPVLHRSLYAPYGDEDSLGGSYGRLLNRALRDRLGAYFSRQGIPLVVEGDVHVGGVSKKLYKSPVTHVVAIDSLGTEYVTLSGAYINRYPQASPSDLPANSFRYTMPVGSRKKAYGLLMTIHGDRAWCQLYKYDVYTETGAVAYSWSVQRGVN
jgi:hypothetical protein